MKHKWLIIFFSSILAIAIIYYGAVLFSGLEPAPDSQQISNDPANPPPSDTVVDSKNQNNPSPTPTPQPTEPTAEEKMQQLVDAQLTKLTLEQKIGQLLILGIEDNTSTVSADTKQLIAEQGIGNIMLFKRNIISEQQLNELTSELKKLPANNVPLWIAIDQEGGKVNRLPEKFPSASELAEQNDTSVTEATGDLMGSTLEQLNIDVDFAPVLDINSNPKNPVIGSRAFGSTAESVITHSTAMLNGLGKHVITVGKHFPGHGDTSVDSHISLPTINKSWEELEQLELIPFRSAIENNIDAIMVGHLFLPELDATYPASLSETIISHYLRDMLDFKGLIITDDLVMGGITEQYKITDAAVRALQAGNTMLIIGHEPEQQKLVRDHLIEAVKQGVLDEALIDEKVRLVLLMKLNKQAFLQ